MLARALKQIPRNILIHSINNFQTCYRTNRRNSRFRRT